MTYCRAENQLRCCLRSPLLGPAIETKMDRARDNGRPSRLVEAQPDEHIAPKALHNSGCFTLRFDSKHISACRPELG